MLLNEVTHTSVANTESGMKSNTGQIITNE